ncbi:MAG: PQQ-binding-like beta-propeller repeat protein, partial [Kofleriaceae bacterium]
MLAEAAPILAAAEGPRSLQYVERLLDGDLAGGERIVDDALASGWSLEAVYVDILQEALYEIGRRWEVSQLTVAQEHFCTAATQQVMASLHARLFATPKRGPRLLATSVGGNFHSIGIRMLADIFELAGWATTCLGADPTWDEVRDALASPDGHDVIAISAALVEHVADVAALIRNVRACPAGLGIHILVGGRPFNADLELWRAVGADGHATTPQAAVDLATDLVTNQPSLRQHTAIPLSSRPSMSPRPPETKLLDAMSRLNGQLHDATRALATKNAELARLNAQVNKMMGMAAHDLRNPLMVLGLHTQLLVEDLAGTLGADQSESLEAIQTATQFMRSLLDDLLDVSKIRAGKLQLEISSVELVGFVRGVVKTNAALAARKQIGVTFSTSVEAVTLPLDAPKIQQLVNNLVGNAVQYSMPGTDVTVELSTTGEVLCLVVRDRGAGIPEAELAKVFRAYETTSTQGTAGEKSTGLGLAIVQAIVEAHGGRCGSRARSALARRSLSSCRSRPERLDPALQGPNMFIVLGILLVVGWVMLKLFVGVTSFAIHLLLAAAVIALIVHFVRGRSGRGGVATGARDHLHTCARAADRPRAVGLTQKAGIHASGRENPLVSLNRRRFLQLTAAGVAALPTLSLAKDNVVHSKGTVTKTPYPGHVNGVAKLPAWDGATSSESVAGSMRMFRGNMAGTYYGSGKLAENLKLVWKFRMSDFATQLKDKPVTWGGTGWTGQTLKYGDYVYSGSVGGHFHCWEANTGKLVWVYPALRMFKGSPCLYKNRIYVPNVDNHIRCLDATNGKVIWDWAGWADCDSSPRILDGKLYIGGEDGDLKCFDAETGKLEWKHGFGRGEGEEPGSEGIECSLAIADNTAYFGHLDGHVRAFSLTEKKQLWKTQKLGLDIDASGLIRGDKLYVGLEEGKAGTFFCRDRATGKTVGA